MNLWHPWMDNAKCAEFDPEIFFTDELRAEAKTICASCPVITQCATHVRSLPDVRDGVWAGRAARTWRKTK